MRILRDLVLALVIVTATPLLDQMQCVRYEARPGARRLFPQPPLPLPIVAVPFVEKEVLVPLLILLLRGTSQAR
jgi:hypothetical protein